MSIEASIANNIVLADKNLFFAKGMDKRNQRMLQSLEFLEPKLNELLLELDGSVLAANVLYFATSVKAMVEINEWQVGRLKNTLFQLTKALLKVRDKGATSASISAALGILASVMKQLELISVVWYQTKNNLYAVIANTDMIESIKIGNYAEIINVIMKSSVKSELMLMRRFMKAIKSAAYNQINELNSLIASIQA